MNAWVGNVLALVIGAVVGGVLTGIFGLKQAADSFRREQDDRRQHDEAQRREEVHRVQTLVLLENKHNTEILDGFWKKVNERLGGQFDEMEFEQRLRLAETPLAEWGHLMWKSQAAFLPEAFTEVQIGYLYEFHTLLDQFTAFRADFQEELSSEIATSMIAKYRRDPDLLRVGSNPAVDKKDPKYQLAYELYVWVRDYNQGTLTRRNECQGIITRMHDLTSLLSGGMTAPTVAPHSPVQVQRSLWSRLLSHLPQIHIRITRRP